MRLIECLDQRGFSILHTVLKDMIKKIEYTNGFESVLLKYFKYFCPVPWRAWILLIFIVYNIILKLKRNLRCLYDFSCRSFRCKQFNEYSLLISVKDIYTILYIGVFAKSMINSKMSRMWKIQTYSTEK